MKGLLYLYCEYYPTVTEWGQYPISAFFQDFYKETSKKVIRVQVSPKTLAITQRPQSSSLLGVPHRIQNINPQKELLWGLWVEELLLHGSDATRSCWFASGL